MNRTLSTLCPGCGAQVGFTGDNTVVAICPYCTTTLLRAGDAIENLGRMAELFEEHSPLQIGARGVFADQGFVIVGRLQYRYPRGTWNEWWLRLDDGDSRWLSEDNGHYVMTRPIGQQAVPPFADLAPGQPLRLDGTDFAVASLAEATVIAGQGELPFIVGAGYRADVVDLRNSEGEFATLDYSGAGDAAAPRAMLYRGTPVTLDSLRLTGLRDSLERRVATEAFHCPGCGAPVQATLESTRSITCAACASLIDLDSGTGGRFDFVRQVERVPPLVAIGTRGRLLGVDWTVVGFQHCEGEVDDEVFEWSEYLLHEPGQGFGFLIEDRGHWSLARTLQTTPVLDSDRWHRPRARTGGRVYRHFASYRSTVDYVEGEFYWQVRRGDRTSHDEYIAPPRGLSREQSGGEITWSEARYLAAPEVKAAFPAARLPATAGIGMLEPAPEGSHWGRRYRRLAIVGVVGLLLIQLAFMLLGGSRRLVENEPVAFGPSLGDEKLVTVAGSRPTKLEILVASNVVNDWFQLDISIASRDRPGEVLTATPEIAFYRGDDGDGPWVEGSRDDRIVFTVEPGPYLVRVGGTANPAAASPPTASWSVVTSTRPGQLVFWIGLLLLIGFNLFGYFGRPDPEGRRWADSLYGSPPKG